MKLIFCVQINIKGFFKLILSFSESVARHAKITQNNKFAISLQYLLKEMSDKVDFLYADKHENLLQIDTMILMGMIKHSQSTQSNKFAISLQCLKKKSGMEFIFCSLYAVCIIVFDGSGQTFPKYPK